jgi:phage replication initiation protein
MISQSIQPLTGETPNLRFKAVSLLGSASGMPSEMPPSNNMGAQITAPSENRVLIDWLSWTLKVIDPHEAIALSGLSFFDFTPCNYGGMGYKSSLRSGNVVVFYDGSEGMGCHISMTGQGCRQFEHYKGVEHCWYQLFHNLFSINANITRIDLAIDNVDGCLQLEKLEDAIRNKHIKTRFKKSLITEGIDLTDKSENLGKTIYLGSPQSRLKIRFYDKAAQLNIKSHWVRCELQCMAERAMEAVKHLLQSKNIGHIAVAALNQVFAVVNLDDSNKSRCTLKGWWSNWLLTTEKIRLSVSKAIRLVDETMQHIEKQYSASLSMIKKYLGVASFNDYMTNLIKLGNEKMTRKHDYIIQSSRLLTEYPF